MTRDDETIKKLDELFNLIEVCDSYNKELGGLIEQAFRNCPDLKKRYDEIQLSLEVLTPRRMANIELITAYVLGKQVSVKGKKLHAIFSSQRTTIVKPSVSIREVKKS